MTTALDLDAQTLAELEGLRERLNHPTRGALLRFLVAEGLRVTRERLEAAAPCDAVALGWSETVRNV